MSALVLLNAAKSGDVDLLRMIADELCADGRLAQVAKESDVLHLAATENWTQVVTTLLDYDEFCRVVNAKKRKSASPPLALAASRDTHEIIQLLLTRGRADPNATDKMHRTALHLAAEHGHYRSLTLLLDYADPRLLDKRGRSPLFYCRAGFSKLWPETQLLPEPNPLHLDHTFTTSPSFKQLIIPTYREISPRQASWGTTTNSIDSSPKKDSSLAINHHEEHYIDFERCFLLLDRKIGILKAADQYAHTDSNTSLEEQYPDFTEAWSDYDDSDDIDTTLPHQEDQFFDDDTRKLHESSAEVKSPSIWDEACRILTSCSTPGASSCSSHLPISNPIATYRE